MNTSHNLLTEMITLGPFIVLTIIICLVAGYFLVRFKFYPIIYFIKGKIIKGKYLSDIENIHLKDFKQKHGIIFSFIPVLGFSWGLVGIILACFLAFNQYYHYFSSANNLFLLQIVNYWIITNILFLSSIPLFFLFTKASIPVGMKRSFNRKLLIFLFLIVIFSLLYSELEYHLSYFALAVLLLLSIPCIFSSWFIGQYFAVFVIRSFYQSLGFDFVLNEKMSLFGHLKGFFSLVFAILAPIIAINSLLAVLYKNTKSGGFIGIWLISIPKVNIHVQIYQALTITFTKPSLTFLTNIIIILLIVGPLVTFIFRPTYIFELTLNSKIYQTLINLNWDNLKEDYGSDDTIIIHSLTKNEMRGVILFFISFINYVAILSVGAVIESFGINLDKVIGLGVLNGTIKLIEIPVLIVVEYLILHDLSEERELVHLASKGRKLAMNKTLSTQLSKKLVIPMDQQTIEGHNS